MKYFSYLYKPACIIGLLGLNYTSSISYSQGMVLNYITEQVDSTITSLHLWKDLMPSEKIEQAKHNAHRVIKAIFQDSLNICSPIYNESIVVNIKYAGQDDDLRGQYRNDTIYIYDLGLKYLDLTTSTLLHEYCAHYMEEIHNQIPNTPYELREVFEINPFYNQPNDYYNGQKIIQYYAQVSPLSSLLEEINGYFLEFEINTYDLTCIEDKDLHDILYQLKEHRIAYLLRINN